MLLPKGTIRVLFNNPNHYYVKLEDEDFAWWRKEDDTLPEDKRMEVRITDKRVMEATHFNVYVPAENYIESNL